MSSSIIQLLKNEKLTDENYATWKSNLNMILVVNKLCFVLIEAFPPSPAPNASQTIKDAYDRWTKANDKAHIYILASMSDVLSKKWHIGQEAWVHGHCMIDYGLPLGDVWPNVHSNLTRGH